ncbi:DNA polymerase III subunit delta [Candidatus Protochlamydia phocaeensis]|uniref:DNA polymerase III subunit delta n=1 Tax=Candidatus Protochlamydia phocaeensis TaxID=1414722 RepID=UPI000838C780|nr:DNA polymerase III subunit delta [Candidatus Protochlamydia phocaeensis]
MKYDNLRAFEKHLEGASPHHFSPLYLILGKDHPECRESIELVLRFLAPNLQAREFSVRTFDGAQLGTEELLIELYSKNFFADKRVLYIQQAEKLKKPVLEQLEKGLSHLDRSLYFILSASSLSKQTSFYKAAEKEGVILELGEIKPWEKEKRLVEWVSKQAISGRKLMAYPVCQALVKYAGLDSALLGQELEKLFCYVGDRKEITLQDVSRICTPQSSDTIWQLGESLFRRDSASAVRIVQALLAEGQALLPLLRQIRTQFQTDYQICLLINQGKQASDIAHEFPYMKGTILDRHLFFAQQYGLAAFKQGLLAIDAMEMRVKNSQADEGLLAELLVTQLTRQL